MIGVWGNMTVIFIPQNEEEEQWKVLKFVEDIEIKSSLSAPILFYSNAEIRISKSIYLYLTPIGVKWKLFIRSIIYACRVFSNDKLRQPIPFYLIHLELNNDKERFKRIMYKVYSERTHLQKSKYFEKNFALIEDYNPERVRGFKFGWRMAMYYGILKESKRRTSSGFMYYLQFTEYGRELIAMHREHGYII